MGILTRKQKMMILILVALSAVAFAKPGLHRDPMINEGLFEGDILGIDPNGDRNAVPRDSQRWPGGVVPFMISPERESFRELLMKAMKHIEESSCVRFVERTNQQDYVKIFNGTGCYSNWGRIGGEQLLSLADGCEMFPVFVHELMHAIGFEHEHNRSDRDDYLTINWHNIREQWYYAFRKLLPEQNRLLSSFDFNSIMLYGSTVFAKEFWTDKYSMVRKDGSFIDDIYSRTSMSASDAQRIKILYNC